MDNRDLTSVNNPMPFWINNEFDRGHNVDCDILGNDDLEQDDSQITDPSLNPATAEPDCFYSSTRRLLNAIPSQRD